MKTGIIRAKTPEEKVLERKKLELASLETKLVRRELDLATLQAELKAYPWT